jgi:hypothetical protein
MLENNCQKVDEYHKVQITSSKLAMKTVVLKLFAIYNRKRKS